MEQYPQDKKQQALWKTIEFLRDNVYEQMTVGDLVKKINDFGDAYGPQYFLDKLKEKSGENIIVTRRNGKPDMVTFRAIA